MVPTRGGHDTHPPEREQIHGSRRTLEGGRGFVASQQDPPGGWSSQSNPLRTVLHYRKSNVLLHLWICNTLQRGPLPMVAGAAPGGPLVLVALLPDGPLPLVTRYSWSSRTSGLPTTLLGSASGLGMYLSIQPPSQLAM